uniref:Tetratricopeptide repeat protein 29 n=1 Tax=Sinocyclocheilus grahami TaxID=75366 RepID=A0A672QQU4_SINGR
MYFIHLFFLALSILFLFNLLFFFLFIKKMDPSLFFFYSNYLFSYSLNLFFDFKTVVTTIKEYVIVVTIVAKYMYISSVSLNLEIDIISMLCISLFPAVGQYGEAYDNHMFLARFFTEPEDKWLKHHFIQLALHSARKFKMDSGKREAEANLHMGQVYLEKGQLERAQEHYEVFYHLTMGRTWQDPSGRMHHSRSCEELQKLFTLLGQRLLQAQDYTHAIKMFNEAYQMAKESGDRGSEGEAAYRLGLAYQSTGDQKTAKQVCSDVCMEISTILKNADSLGRAYEAIAKSLERKTQCFAMKKYKKMTSKHGSRHIKENEKKNTQKTTDVTRTTL